ncbi:hypothetical protein DSUL_20328 [Desulfovibrionales bacterium]
MMKRQLYQVIKKHLNPYFYAFPFPLSSAVISFNYKRYTYFFVHQSRNQLLSG